MVEIRIDYQGKLRCLAEHVDSGTTLITDAPRDNQGEGKSFSPTDLVATALGTCMMTVMGIAARRLSIDLTGSKCVVLKEMATTPHRRIGKLSVTIEVPTPLSEEQQTKLKNAAMTCPVHHSLHPDVQMPITFKFASLK
jgi:putative redox protein